MSLKKLFLIDGSSYAYRAFFALGHLSTSKGIPTNATYGFTNMILKLLKEENPQYIAVCFDLAEPTFRHLTFTEYKSHRPPMPAELSAQLPWIKQIISALGIKLIEKAGYEADDLLATIAKRAVKDGFEVIVVTADKDALQLVSTQIKVMRIHEGKRYIYDEDAVKQKYGVSPEKLPDLIGLMGDASDNIPGVPGIGEKTAKALLSEFGSIEELYAELDRVEPIKRRKLLEEYKDQVFLSRSLATLRDNVPLDSSDTDWTLYKIQEKMDTKNLIKIFHELEFNSLLPEVMSFNKFRETEFVDIVDISFCLLDSSEQVKQWKSELPKFTEIALELVTKNDNIYYSNEKKEEGLLFSENLFSYFIPKIAIAVYVPRKGNFLIYSDPSSSTLKMLEDFFSDSAYLKVGHNLKNIISNLRKLNIPFAGGVFDTMIAAYLLQSHRNNYALEEIVFEYLGKELLPLPEISDKNFPQVLCKRTQMIADLTAKLKELLQRDNLEFLFKEVELPLVEVLVEMEQTGIKVDADYFNQLSYEIEEELTGIKNEIYRIAGEPFNINSSKQIAHILYKKLKLPAKKRTKTGLATSGDILEELSVEHPLPKKIIEYRALHKLKSTYIDGLLKLINPRTGFLHTSFNQIGTVTGRLSSSEPNLQNLPVQSEWGIRIRKGFIPKFPENYFISADYSQIELRLLAHYSEDENLINAFQEGKDIHKETAAELFNISLENVTPEMRRFAKTINFGIIYGITPLGLSHQLNISQTEAKEWIDKYFLRYPKVRNYITSVIEQAQKVGYVQTLFNRRRYLPEINSANNQLREFAERQAINAPLQGTAADLMKIALVNIYRKLKSKKLKSHLLLTIHDEIILEVPQEEIEAVHKLLKEEMESIIQLRVPIVVDIKVERNLAEC